MTPEAKAAPCPADDAKGSDGSTAHEGWHRHGDWCHAHGIPTGPSRPAPAPEPERESENLNKRWPIYRRDFDPDGCKLFNAPARSLPYEWESITADNATRVRVTVNGRAVPFSDRMTSGSRSGLVVLYEWTVDADVTAGAVVIVLDGKRPIDRHAACLRVGGNAEIPTENVEAEIPVPTSEATP